MAIRNKNLLTILGIVLSILLIPLIAMQFSNEVNWSTFDFIVAGTLLFLMGLTIEFILNKFKTKKQRLIFLTLSIGAFLIIWIELAVGIFGTPFAGS